MEKLNKQKNIIFPQKPISGVGIGLRQEHYQEILLKKPKINWFEIITENYLGNRELPLYYLEKIRQEYPIAMHGVGLSICSCDPINYEYLNQVKELAAFIEPEIISDHLSFSALNNKFIPELLPVPRTPDIIEFVANKIIQVQDFLDSQLLFENISSYLEFADSISEWEFINEITDKADCDILLDINNIYVNSQNHGFDPKEYIKNINPSRVKQIHLAGFINLTSHLLDDHGSKIAKEVWALYEFALKIMGNIPTLIEWDNNIPKFDTLLDESQKAKQIMDATSVHKIAS